MKGLCSAIGLKEFSASLTGTTGYEKIRKLFQKAGVLYHKGFDIINYVGSLNIGVIRNKRQSALKGLEEALGVEIEK